MFNGLCGRGSEAEWEACRSVDLEGVERPRADDLCLYCTHSEVLAVSVLVGVCR